MCVCVFPLPVIMSIVRSSDAGSSWVDTGYPFRSLVIRLSVKLPNFHLETLYTQSKHDNLLWCSYTTHECEHRKESFNFGLLKSSGIMPHIELHVQQRRHKGICHNIELHVNYSKNDNEKSDEGNTSACLCYDMLWLNYQSFQTTLT